MLKQLSREYNLKKLQKAISKCGIISVTFFQLNEPTPYGSFPGRILCFDLPKPNPKIDIKAAEEHLKTWLLKFDLCEKNSPYLKFNLANALAYICLQETSSTFNICLDWSILIGFMLDDWLEDSLKNGNSQDAHNLINALTYILIHHSIPDDIKQIKFPKAEQLANALLDIVNRLLANNPDLNMTRFMMTFKKYFEYLIEFLAKTQNNLGLNEYLNIHGAVFGDEELLELILLVRNIKLPEFVYDNKYFIEFKRCANHAIAIGNDLFSFSKDLDTNNKNNMILILKREKHITTIQKAFEEGVKLYNDHIIKLCSLKNQLRKSLMIHYDAKVQELISLIETLVQSNSHWSLQTTRYRKTKSESNVIPLNQLSTSNFAKLFDYKMVDYYFAHINRIYHKYENFLSQAVQQLASTSDSDDLSNSVFDIAIVALVNGTQQKNCIQWLKNNIHADGSLGCPKALSWYDNYICTYAASIAFRNAGLIQEYENCIKILPKIAEQKKPGDIESETLTFGGFIGALDRFAAERGLPVFSHNEAVAMIVQKEADKWTQLVQWKEFYNPKLSIAGYCGECAYHDNRVDFERFISAFQMGNGSIARSPASSAMVLLELEERPISLTNAFEKLKNYVYSCDPNERKVGYLDNVTYFTTAWALLDLSELDIPYTNPILAPLNSRLEKMYNHFLKGDKGMVTCLDANIAGDADSTSCIMDALDYANYPVMDNVNKLEYLFNPQGNYYQTYAIERNPSISTNIHMLAVLAKANSPHLTGVLNWLQDQCNQKEYVKCKWHTSQFYAMGELARSLGHIDHPIAKKLVLWAGNYLLTSQKTNGGWGTQSSSIEETSYAVLGLARVYQILLNEGKENKNIYQALLKAKHFLLHSTIEYQPFWIGPSLYCVRPLVPWVRDISILRIHMIQALHHKERMVAHDSQE